MCFSSCSLSVSSLLGIALLPGICFSIAEVLRYLVWPGLCIAVFLWIWSFLPSRIIPAGFSAGMTWPPLTDLTLCQQGCLNIIPSHPHLLPLSLPPLLQFFLQCHCYVEYFCFYFSGLLAWPLHLPPPNVDVVPNPFCGYVCSRGVHWKSGIYLLQTLPYLYLYFVIFSLTHSNLCCVVTRHNLTLSSWIPRWKSGMGALCSPEIQGKKTD